MKERESKHHISPCEKCQADSLENKYLIHPCVKKYRGRKTHPRCAERSTEQKTTSCLWEEGATWMLPWSRLLRMLEKVLGWHRRVYLSCSMGLC